MKNSISVIKSDQEFLKRKSQKKKEFLNSISLIKKRENSISAIKSDQEFLKHKSKKKKIMSQKQNS